MPQRETDVKVAIFGCVGLFPAMVASIWLRGWALLTLWGWFVTPMWHVAAPSMASALGLSLLIGLLTNDYPDAPKDPSKSTGEVLLTAYAKLLLASPLSVGMGWVCRLYEGEKRVRRRISR